MKKLINITFLILHIIEARWVGKVLPKPTLYLSQVLKKNLIFIYIYPNFRF